MYIEKITGDKKRFIELLLLADEQEDMIDRYLGRGDMYVLRGENGAAAGVCVVTTEPGGVVEIKNIAVSPVHQGRGYGRLLLDYVYKAYKGKGETLLVGTGDVPGSRGFYENCGFVYSHRVKNFFTDNYDHPIVEDGIQLVDMIYLAKKLPG